MIQVMVQTFQEPFILIPFLGNILWTVGCIPLGLAIWRSGRLWKWADCCSSSSVSSASPRFSTLGSSN